MGGPRDVFIPWYGSGAVLRLTITDRAVILAGGAAVYWISRRDILAKRRQAALDKLAQNLKQVEDNSKER